MRTRAFLLTGLLVALLVAGVGSYYASAHPDGLSAVAEKTGISDREKESPVAGGPFAGYQTKGVDNDRLSGGLAGLTGALVVLALGGGLFWLVRRRPDDDTTTTPPGA
jgi:cobalt/nickel transport protein